MWDLSRDIQDFKHIINLENSYIFHLNKAGCHFITSMEYYVISSIIMEQDFFLTKELSVTPIPFLAYGGGTSIYFTE